MSSIVMHTVNFAFLNTTKQFRAHCSCGWRRFGPCLNDLQALASVHDFDEEDRIDPKNLKHETGENICEN